MQPEATLQIAILRQFAERQPLLERCPLPMGTSKDIDTAKAEFKAVISADQRT